MSTTDIRTAGLYIAGVEKAASSGQTFEVLAPATETVMGTAARANAQDVDEAVQSAKAGYITWSELAPRDREARLLKAADIMVAEGEERYLDLLMDESGSVINKARFEINYTVDLLRTAAGESRRLYGDTFPNDDPSRLSMVIREPIGVVAIVSPYNAPLALLAKMTAFPLAAGNSVVIKPSEETPFIAIEFAKLLVEAGIPAQAVNVVTGFGKDCGAALVNHEDIRSIALTGSTATGKMIGASAMQRMCRTQLELGGKSALLVLKDSDPTEAAQVAVTGMFNHAGQICMANSRIIVEEEIYDDFIAAIKIAAEALVLGDLRDTKTAYGPLINRISMDKVQGHIDAAVAGGATVLTGGEPHSGLVYKPTILINPPRDCSAWCDESFGPLTSVVAAKDLDEAIEIANDSSYGLSAGVLTKNVQWGFQAARRINAGAVHIGMHSFQSNAVAPVGGTGDSGLGRSGGKYSIEEFTELKWISVQVS